MCQAVCTICHTRVSRGDKRWTAGTISLEYHFKGEIPEPVSKGIENRELHGEDTKANAFQMELLIFSTTLAMVIRNTLLRM